MGDLTDNFWSYEVRCKCPDCRDKPVPYHIVEKVKLLQKARDWSNKLIGLLGLDLPEIKYPVESGHRCPAYDRKIGGKGEHSVGAFDIKYKSTQLLLILIGAFVVGCRRFGLEKNVVHLGFAPSKKHPPWRFWHYYSRYEKKKKKGGHRA